MLWGAALCAFFELELVSTNGSTHEFSPRLNRNECISAPARESSSIMSTEAKFKEPDLVVPKFHRQDFQFLDHNHFR